MAITKPNIVQKAAAPSNFTPGRTSAVKQITFHHIVGDAPGALARFANPTQQVSSNYVIGSDGVIYGVVAENDTAWCDANWGSNCRTISIEHAGGHANVPYTDAMYEASTRLVAYLINKYGIDSFKRHREVSTTPTACCGTLDIDRIINGARQLIIDAGRPVPAPVSSPDSSLGSVFLPAWVQTWALYHEGTQLRKGTADQKATICPAEFGGLTYKIVSRVGDYAVVIDTEMFGRGVIWTKETDARFIQDSQAAPVQAPVEPPAPPAPAAPVEPAAPAVTVVPAPVEAAAPAVEYTKLAQPLSLQLNKATSVVQLTTGQPISELAEGAEFTAFGKAQLTNESRTCFYMTEEDFGQAETTGAPTRVAGVNTIHLSPRPTPVEAVPAPVTPVEVVAAPVAVTPPAAPAAAPSEDNVQVTVVNDPLAWQKTFKPFLGPVEYVAQTSTKVGDLANPNAAKQQLVKHGIYKIAGPFVKDGIKYLRTVTSTNNKTWYGIPEVSLERKDEVDKDNFVDDMLQVADHLRREAGNYTRHEKNVIKAANLDGFLGRFKKKGDKK
jgi:hypothetical protein